ncbi:hypothetical protein H2204_013208 [Knufia peltigerae]|uniref:Uncharacterized protein n=1 Tax=Knufia peltigerae TaxID=1002370 RepID=A0AA39CRK7_9EURO|nr:hypothetical protein H2204_013208 [Knufia peltigerae]
MARLGSTFWTSIAASNISHTLIPEDSTFGRGEGLAQAENSGYRRTAFHAPHISGTA